jgi:hypothetical protein
LAMKRAILLTCLASFVSASPGLAQRWGREALPRDGVCFYKDPNFNGDYFCVRSGESVASMPNGMNDKISSMRVVGRAEAIVFKDIRFAGRSSRFDRDIRNLRDDGWDDVISSIRVEPLSRGGFGRPGAGVRRGEDADRIVRRAYQDLLGREPDPTGLRIYRSHIIDEGWSEGQVRDELRNSAEFRDRNSMTPARAQEIVRRAYLAVLKREPDPGSRGFVDRVLRDHWSQQDVERELRNSPEYRRR